MTQYAASEGYFAAEAGVPAIVRRCHAIVSGALILFHLVNTTQQVPLGLTSPLFGAF
ncbi:hypothetical protein [Nocardia sp. NPDC058497]|uniref:hypothetical protein n=1 Tax=Nocardia sp. NPDC058497 TaxID=3346529 RepID=UPI0036540E07